MDACLSWMLTKRNHSGSQTVDVADLQPMRTTMVNEALLRDLAVALILAVGACSASPSRSQASGDRPFTVTEVARFEAPWALDFLPGSGVPKTNMALVTEKAGKLWLVES